MSLARCICTCLDGVGGKSTIDGVKYELHEGESIVMPAKRPHAVMGKEKFKMLLVVISRVFFKYALEQTTTEKYYHVIFLQSHDG